ncbi:MAG: acetate uptake transporter [Solirubrobacteraceae bacterium]
MSIPNVTDHADVPSTNGSNGSGEKPVTIVASPVIATPAPLGLLAIALTTFLLSMVNGHFVSSAVEPVVFGELFAFGGIVLILSGMWAFRAGSTFGGTAFTGYGGFFLSFWALFQFYIKDIPPAQIGNAIGLYLSAWALFTVVMLIASFRTNRVTSIVFGLLLAMLIVSAIGNAGADPTLIHWGGYLGLVDAAGAAYIACAEFMQDLYGRSILPLKPW